jgi:hypothetical protein
MSKAIINARTMTAALSCAGKSLTSASYIASRRRSQWRRLRPARERAVGDARVGRLVVWTGETAGRLSGRSRSPRCPTQEGSPIPSIGYPRNTNPPRFLGERYSRRQLFANAAIDASGTSFRGLDRPNREIDGGYRSDFAQPSIVLIGQSEFSGVGRSKDRRHYLACDLLSVGTHSHHRDKIDFECKVFHSNCNVTAAVFVPLSCA